MNRVELDIMYFAILRLKYRIKPELMKYIN